MAPKLGAVVVELPHVTPCRCWELHMNRNSVIPEYGGYQLLERVAAFRRPSSRAGHIGGEQPAAEIINLRFRGVLAIRDQDHFIRRPILHVVSRIHTLPTTPGEWWVGESSNTMVLRRCSFGMAA